MADNPLDNESNNLGSGVGEKHVNTPSSLYRKQRIDSKGGSIVLPEAEVSLHIPEGALSEPTFLSIEIVFDRDGGQNGISAACVTPTVACKPQGQTFRKKVELILPHCARFDDASLQKAKVHVDNGGLRVGTGGDVFDDVNYKLTERFCYVYTTHFSDFHVYVCDTEKKRMGVIPFIGQCSENKVDLKVWFINDIPSEYIFVRHENEASNCVPFDIDGKFILHKQSFACRAETICGRDSQDPACHKKDLETNELFRKSRLCESIETTLKDCTAIQKKFIISILRKERKKPVCRLEKHDGQKGPSGNKASILKELTQVCDQISECLLEWDLEDLQKRPLFDCETINLLRQTANEVEKNRRKKNIGVSVGSGAGALGGSLAIAGALLTPFTFGASLALLATGSAIAVAGSGVSLGFSIENIIKNKITKDKVKNCLTSFVKFQDNLVTSLANIFEARSVIGRLQQIEPTRFGFVDTNEINKLKGLIMKHEAGLHVDFITLHDVVQQLKDQSTDLITCLKHVEEKTEPKLLELKSNLTETLSSHIDEITSYECRNNDVNTFVQFAKNYLHLNTGTGTVGVGVDTSDLLHVIGRTAVAAASVLHIVGGVAVQVGFLGNSLYNLLSDKKDQFAQQLLEVAKLMESINVTPFSKII